MADNLLFIIPLVLFTLFGHYIQLPVIVKRFHDTNRSGWNILWYIFLIMLAGFLGSSGPFSALSEFVRGEGELGDLFSLLGLLYLLIFCGYAKGNPEPNDYGNPPN